jgi:hypothetical protein
MSNEPDALTERLGLGDQIRGRNDDLDLRLVRTVKYPMQFGLMRSTLIGRLSMRMPFNLVKALLAPSACWNMTWATPRLTPPGP